MILLVKKYFKCDLETKKRKRRKRRKRNVDINYINAKYR